MPTSAKSAPTSSKKGESHPATHQDDRDAAQRRAPEHPEQRHEEQRPDPRAAHHEENQPLAPEDDPYDNVACTD